MYNTAYCVYFSLFLQYIVFFAENGYQLCTNTALYSENLYSLKTPDRQNRIQPHSFAKKLHADCAFFIHFCIQSTTNAKTIVQIYNIFYN